MEPFQPFSKIPRLSRECIITEKIDGTNAQVYITPEGDITAASRTRYITIDNDNYGFAKFVEANKEELLKLGPGRHYGEWWGPGINRGYGLKDKQFSLFNVRKWSDSSLRPACCAVVPILAQVEFNTAMISDILNQLAYSGSVASPGFMRPEGIVIYHIQSGYLFKKTIEGDEVPKGKGNAQET